MSKQRTYRLSAQQRRIWRQQRDQARVLVARCQLAIEGPVEAGLLLDAVHRTAQAHEIFRTSFDDSNEGMIVQPVDEFAGVETWQQDWTELSGDEQEKRMLAVWAGERSTMVNLGHGPRLRAGFVRLSDSRCELLLTIPSLCTDAESLMKFAREIQEHYSAAQPQNVEENVLSYSQYTEWQHKLAGESDAKRAMEYWQRVHTRYENARESLAWELDDDQPEGLGSAEIEIEDSIVRRLQGVAEATGSTLETLLLACWQVLLWRLNNRKPVPLSVWFGGRDSEELKRIQGPMGRYLPVTADLYEGTELKVLVENLRELTHVARQLQEYCPEEAITGVFRFTYQELAPEWMTECGRCRIRRTHVEMDSSCLDLTCVMIPEDGRVRLRTALHYEGAGCDEKILRRIPARWRQLLLSAAEDAGKPIECLQIVEGLERRQLLQDFNSPLPSYSSDRICLHELFEEQVRRSPQAQAVVHAGKSLSYDELNRKANQMARYLRRMGVGPEVVVGIALERSPQMIQTVLAVLKAGGAYLPLEPGYPLERLHYMLRDSSATVVVAETDVLQRLAEAAGSVQWVCPEPETHLIAAESPANLDIPVDPQNLAYLIYTSGSTGKPKATMIPHSGVVNYLKWGIEYYGAATGSLLHSSLGFDLTVTSLFLPLLSGGSVRLVKAQAGAEIQNLAQALSVTTEPLLLKMTPAHANLLGQVTQPAKLASEISVMVVGGEALHPQDVAWCRQRWPHIRIINEYGPTETVVGCCVHEMAWEGKPAGNVPIGRPIHNTRIYVLDHDLHLAPIGTQGEIYVSGEGVGRGYCKRPELTAERFLPDPYAGVSGKRMYRTGDLGRWRGSGVLECLGRNDHQVKLGGYRIELGEIEAVLREMNVRDAAVVKHQENGAECLVAYVTPREQSQEKRAVLSHLSAKLPHYMVPKLIVFLDLMPYTANGKLDRRALPDPWQLQSGKPLVAPRTDREEWLAGVWAEVLERRPVGVEDGFFDLGGHSMSAVRIAARIQSAVGVEITAQRIFEAGTVAGLALVIEEELRKGSRIQASLPQAVAGNRPQTLSYAQQRLWFFDQLSPASATFNLVQALHITGPLRLDVLERTCNEIIRRHEVLRTTFPTVRGEAQQHVAPFRSFKLAAVDLSLQPDPRGQAERLIRREEQTPFDLARGPLHRISVYRLVPEEHIVVFSVHHIIFDGWSTSVFLRELSMLYTAFSSGLQSPLPDLPIQYADFAYWESTTIQGERMRKYADFWRSELRPPLPVLNLPLDHVRPEMPGFHGAKHDFVLSAGLTEALNKLAQRCGATLFMTLLGVFDSLLHVYTGQTDIVVGTDVANRPGAAAESLIGFFVNQLPLRIDLGGNPEFTEVLGRVRENALRAYAYQEMPFDRLVDALRLQRNSSRAPLFQVKLVLENIPDAKLDLPGLEVNPLAFTHISAKLDLTLLLRESSGRVGGWFEYNSDLFEAATIAAMAENFETLLSVVVERPSIRLDALAGRLGNLRTSAESSTQVALRG